jgi:hypothetical protein
MVGDQWYNLRPDALAEYHVGQQHFRFWLEWDRGTMNARDLSIKFQSYGHYIASRKWAREDSRLPFLVCVAPDIAQERRMQREAQTKLVDISGLVMWTTTEVMLAQYNPLASIWLQSLPKQGHKLQDGRVPRQSWTEMIS